MSWTRHGECNQCGDCCRSIATVPLVRDPAEIQDRAFYDVRGFKEMRVEGQPRLVLLATFNCTCPQLLEGFEPHVGSYNRCKVYDTRPQTCQDYPTSPLDVVGKRCSYWFERDGRSIGGLASPHPADAVALVSAEA